MSVITFFRRFVTSKVHNKGKCINYNSLLTADGPIIFRQLFEPVSCTYTYLIGDAESRKALIIDPVLETVERDAQLAEELGLKLNYVVNTHCHADHVTGTGALKKLIGSSCKSVISSVSGAKADIYLVDNQLFNCGGIQLECRSTPGHTLGCFTYVLHKSRAAFTGDALLIRGCGRTDFQGGCPETLYKSVHSQILSLHPEVFLFPAHDYTGRTVTTVREEKKYNLRFNKSKTQFVELMNNLKLAYPKQMDRAVPLNLACGIPS